MNYIVLADGKTVYLEIPYATGTSNATTATLPSLPSLISPTTAQNGTLQVVSGGTAGGGIWFIAAAGNSIQFGSGSSYGPGGFSNTLVKSVPALASSSGVVTITYPLSP
jgi:hypothetical protein